jgi:hypothetical protein
MRTNRRKFLQATGTAGLLLTTAPLSAMAAARTRQPDLAPDFLLLDTPQKPLFAQRPQFPTGRFAGQFARQRRLTCGHRHDVRRLDGRSEGIRTRLSKGWQMVRAPRKSATMDVIR